MHGVYLGIGGSVKKVPKILFGAGGVKNVKEGYIGVGSKPVLFFQSGVISALPTFTGTSTTFGNLTKGYIQLKSSGTLTLPKGTYDICIVDAGEKGDYTYVNTCTSTCSVMYCATPDDEEITYQEGDYTSYEVATADANDGIMTTGSNIATAGQGGYVSNYTKISIAAGNYAAVIGASSQGTSSLTVGSTVYSTANASSKAYSGAGSGTNGSGGSGTTTKPFGGDSTDGQLKYPYAGGGSKVSGTAGGELGGGAYNTAGTANTGGGGGIPSTTSGTSNVTIAGGSGTIFIRWGY